MFNQKAALPKSKPDEIVNALAIEPGQNIADIGSGGGYFTLRFAEVVGNNGRVFPVDTDKELLGHIRSEAAKKDLNNITTVHVTNGFPTLSDNSLDLIFLRNAYHHLDNRVAYMAGFKTKLKPNGSIAIVEYKPGGSIFHWKRFFGHNVPKQKIINELEQAGYTLIAEHGFLPEQSFTIYGVQ